MQQNTYPDGFPLTPLEAIDFSYTFSTEEKNEWREWVKTATPEQQQELVETLHAIWIENQKEVIPEGFDKKNEAMQNIIEVPSTQQSQPKEDLPEKIEQKSQPVNIKTNPPDQKSEITKVENLEKETKQPNEPRKDFVFNNTPSIQEKVKIDNVAVKSNGIEEPKDKQQQKPIYNNNYQQNIQKNQTQAFVSQNKEDKKAEMSFFDFARVRETATRAQLEQLQKEYLSTRQKKNDIERNYSKQLTELSLNLEEKQQILFDKVVQITLNFENVSDYLQLMTEKLLKINESNIELEKKVKSLELTIDNKTKDLMYDKEGTQHDIDRLFREQRELREGLRGEILEIKRSSSASTVDNFGGDGLKIKIDILNNKLSVLENTIKNQASQTKQSKQASTQKFDDRKMLQPKIDDNSEAGQANLNTDGTLDLRDII